MGSGEKNLGRGKHRGPAAYAGPPLPRKNVPRRRMLAYSAYHKNGGAAHKNPNRGVTDIAGGGEMDGLNRRTGGPWAWNVSGGAWKEIFRILCARPKILTVALEKGAVLLYNAI